MEHEPNSPTVEAYGQFFDTSCPMERDCLAQGGHRWGKTLYSGDDGDGGPDLTQAYHKCNHCFRNEPL